MDANTTVRGDSNFRHFAAALRKRGYDNAADYITGLAHGRGARHMTATQCWAQCREAEHFVSMAGFFEEVADHLPAKIVAARTAAEAGASISRILFECGDPFRLLDEAEEIEVRLKRAHIERVLDVLESRPFSERSEGSYLGDAVAALREALS